MTEIYTLEESIIAIRVLLYNKAVDLLKLPKQSLYKLDDEIDLNLIKDLKASSLKRINGYAFITEDSILTEHSDDIIVISKFRINDIVIVRGFVKYVPEIISDVFILNTNDLKLLKEYFK